MLQEEDYDADEILREYGDYEHEELEIEDPIEELDFEKESGEPLEDMESDLGDSGDLLDQRHFDCKYL